MAACVFSEKQVLLLKFMLMKSFADRRGYKGVEEGAHGNNEGESEQLSSESIELERSVAARNSIFDKFKRRFSETWILISHRMRRLTVGLG